MSNEYQISVESARIKIGPFTINLEQDKTVSVPQGKSSHPELDGALGFLADVMQNARMAADTPRALSINLRCKQCQMGAILPHVEAVREFMLLHAGHSVEMVP